MNVNNEPQEPKAHSGKSLPGRWFALSVLVASTSLPTACLPQVDIAQATSRATQEREMFCPPNQEPTTTPQLAPLATTTPTLIPTLPARPIEGSLLPSPKPTINPHANTYGQESVIRTYICFDRDPITKAVIGPSPQPTRTYILFPPNPQRSPDPLHTPYGR